jgi:catechol 2,3-dioxygenase-like lactoylglutathione lyase family enzyme
MTTLNYILLAVADPLKSETFYSRLLDIQPVEKAPTFVLYVLPNGIKLGLWIKDEMEPKPLPAGGVEVTFTEPDRAAVSATYETWKQRGATIVREPSDKDFGFTFAAKDPDGYILRVFARAENPR